MLKRRDVNFRKGGLKPTSMSIGYWLDATGLYVTGLDVSSLGLCAKTKSPLKIFKYCSGHCSGNGIAESDFSHLNVLGFQVFA